MATTSTMTELGSRVPDFSLPDVTTGRLVRLEDLDGTGGLLVMFLCRHCPYVAHVREGVARMANDYADADLSIVAISS
ncbi:MAG: redoxin domain-containing protein, partial [Actinomycetota bacterium]